jgi:hypothetical protein
VYIGPFPSGLWQVKVSSNGGQEPRWGPDGNEIYYIEQGFRVTLMAATLRPRGADVLEVSAPYKLFEYGIGGLVAPPYNSFSYSPGADGRFLVNVPAVNSDPAINLISNWQKFAADRKER